MSEVRCTFCEKEFPQLPSDAVPVGKRRGTTQLYRFTDGTVHNLVSTKVGRKKKAENSAEEK